jgi:biotin transport system substrate-specific component
MVLLAPPRNPVLVDALVRRRTLVTDIALIAAAVAVVAISAQVSVPLWPVPVTAQTLAVLVVGAALGPWRGATALVVYAVVGLAGLPVFADLTGGPLAVLKPSFGFVIGFIPSAFVAGMLARRAWDRRFGRALATFGIASALPFVIGLPYLALILGRLGLDNSLPAVLMAGLVPFIPGGIVKTVLAAGLMPLAWRGARAVERRRDERP